MLKKDWGGNHVIEFYKAGIISVFFIPSHWWLNDLPPYSKEKGFMVAVG